MELAANNAERNHSIDLMKGWAVLAMIQVHLTELFAVSWWQEQLGGKISLFLGGPAAAPMLMVVMGYLAGKFRRLPVYFIQRGAKMLLWGLLLNLGMNAHLLLRILLDGWAYNPWQYVFGVDILFLAGLSMIMLAMLVWAGQLWWLPALTFAILLLGLTGQDPFKIDGNNLMVYLMAFIHSDAEWSYFPLVPWAIYPLAGFAVARLESVFGKVLHVEKYLWMAMGISLLVLMVFFEVGWNAATNLKVWYHHPPMVIVWNLLFVAFACFATRLYLMAYHGQRTTIFLLWVGRNVTAFYVFQWLIIGNLATAMYQTKYPLLLLLWFALVLGSSSALVWLWNKLKPVIHLNRR